MLAGYGSHGFAGDGYRVKISEAYNSIARNPVDTISNDTGIERKTY